MSKKVAICYIATGPYIQFFDKFRETARLHFLPEYDRHFFIWSDKPIEECNDTTYIHKAWEKWPEAALYRFRTFLTKEEELSAYDYICFFNANSYIARDIHPQDIIDPNLPFSSAVHMQMPYMEKAARDNWIKNCYWSNQPESPAFIPLETLLKSYGGWLMGGFQLGCAKEFLEMCHTITNWMEFDRKAGRILKWHDEPYFNKYAMDKGVKRLPPEYLYPLGYDTPAKKNAAIVITDKVSILGREDFRHNPNKKQSLIERCTRKQ